MNEKRRITSQTLAGVMFLLMLISVFRAAPSDRQFGYAEAPQPAGLPVSRVTYTSYMSQSQEATNIDVARMGGNDRFETANLIAREGWASSKAVMLASADSYADALSGAPLAYACDAPVLLVRGEAISDSVMEEIKRLGSDTIYILGGTAAVSADIENSLIAQGYTVNRIWGATRYETSVEIAKALSALREGTGEVFIASGENYPDALAGSSVAALKGSPILYSPASGQLDEATIGQIIGSGANVAYILGGSNAIGEEAFSRLTDAGMRSISRLGGSDRYDTALIIARNFDQVFTSSDISIATGTNFPDALAGSVLAAKRGIPVLLTGNGGISSDLKDYISWKHPTDVFVFGSTGVIPEEILKDYLSASDTSDIRIEDMLNIGKCGDRLFYTLTKQGTLTVSGTGEMWDFTDPAAQDVEEPRKAAWYDYRKYIKNVTVDTDVTNIGSYAFYGCGELTEVKLQNEVETIGRAAFCGCEKLAKISFPSSLISIKESAFLNCKKLTGVKLPDSLRFIGSGAFANCATLSSVNIPAAVTAIEPGAFSRCPMSAAGLTVAPGNTSYITVNGILYSADMTVLLFCPPTISGQVIIPDGVREIYPEAFYGCEHIAAVTIPESVAAIGTRAFDACNAVIAAPYDCAHYGYDYNGEALLQWKVVAPRQVGVAAAR